MSEKTTSAKLAQIRDRLAGASKRWEMTRNAKTGVKLWADGEARAACLSTVESSRISDDEPYPLWLRDMRFLLSARQDIEFLLALLAESDADETLSAANARLIGAAPDMLRVLEDALVALDASDQDSYDDGALTGRIRETIAKATGGSSRVLWPLSMRRSDS